MTAIRVGRRRIEISRPDKLLFPDGRYTKSDVISYYRDAARFMLPETRDRPMTLERYPDGIGGQRFFSKDIPAYFPDWITRRSLAKEGGEVTHVVCNDAATLVYLANQAAITLHVGLSRVDRVEHPDQVIFDLDPSNPDFSKVRAAARLVKELLQDVGLVPFVKSSGSKGLHVVAPLDRSAHFKEVRSFARDAAHLLAARHPHELTVEHRKEKRAGRLFVDWLRNAYAQHAAAPYSLRPRPFAPVAMPLEWDEVDDDGLRPDRYTIENAVDRAGVAQPWKGWRRRARSIRRARSALDELMRSR